MAANLKKLKKGDKVNLFMFTGAFVESKVIEMADAKKIGFTNKKGIKMTFDKETGKQIDPKPKKETYANYIDVYDAKVEAAAEAKRANKKTSDKPKVTKKVAVTRKKNEDVEELD